MLVHVILKERTDDEKQVKSVEDTLKKDLVARGTVEPGVGVWDFS